MKVLFISANTEKINMPALPLGAACVAAAVRKSGHDVDLVDLMSAEEPHSKIEEAISGFHPDIIAISVRNIDDQRMENTRFLLGPVREIVAECRRISKAPVVLGGAGYSIFPGSALSFLGGDMGIQGEGEGVFPDLVERIAKRGALSSFPGLYLPGEAPAGRKSAGDLDSFPLPPPDLLSLPREKESLWIPVQTRRGCPLGCSYCSTGLIEGRRIRRRSSDSVVRWMALWRKAGIRQFYFVDNTFNLPAGYAREICRKLIEFDLDIKWWGILYPMGVDEELARLMRQAGCEQVSVGFESGSERILKNLKKRFLREDVRVVSARLADHGIRRMGFLLFGTPGETRDSVEESLAFADSLNLDSLKLTSGVRIYPHTLLAEQAAKEGVISPREDLLSPRFYLAPGLREWLPDTLRQWTRSRPNWIQD